MMALIHTQIRQGTSPYIRGAGVVWLAVRGLRGGKQYFDIWTEVWGSTCCDEKIVDGECEDCPEFGLGDQESTICRQLLWRWLYE